MSQSKLGLCFIALIAVVSTALAAEPPPGFEEHGVLEKVKAGEIVKTEVVATKKEFKSVFRAFFKKTSPDAYTALATNHPKYPQLFSDIKEAKTVNANAEGTEFDYWLHVVLKVGIFTQHVYPEGHQSYKRAVDEKSEATIVHNITNYKEYLESAVETTRLIPYEDGMLLHDTVHIKLLKDNAQSTMIKNKLNEQFERFISTFRKELQGDY